MISLTKLWAIGSALAALLLVAGAWFMGVSPQLDAISANQQQQSATAQQNKAGVATLAALRAERKNLPSYAHRLQTLQSSVPGNEETSAFLREIGGHARADGVSITGVTFGTPAGYTVPGAPTSHSASAPAAGSKAAASGVKASSRGTRNSAGDPRITSTNFFSIPVSINVTGQRPDVLQFVGDMQHGARLYLVQSMTMSLDTTQSSASRHGSGSPTGTTFTATIGGLIYMFHGEGGASTAH